MTGFYTLLVRPQLKFFRPNENGLEAQHSRCANRFNRDQSAETANSACRGEPYAKRQKCPQASEEESRASQEESQSSEEIGAGEEESWAGEKSRASEEDRVSEENSTSEEESWASKESSIARKRRSQSRLHWRMLKHLPARCTHAVPTKQAEAVLGGLVTLTAAILKQGDEICLTGLGILQVRKSAARIGRNPASGAAIKIRLSKSHSDGSGNDGCGVAR